MRISDWSSDVCSSDLQPQVEQQDEPEQLGLRHHQAARQQRQHRDAADECQVESRAAQPPTRQALDLRRRYHSPHPHLPIQPQDGAARSEEHTSELQSLMRISYAVFCLKKTTKT